MNHGHNRLGLTMMKPFVIARRSVSPQDHSQSDSRVVRHRKIDELVNCDEEPPRQLLHTAARIFRRLQADPGEQGGGAMLRGSGLSPATVRTRIGRDQADHRPGGRVRRTAQRQLAGGSVQTPPNLPFASSVHRRIFQERDRKGGGHPLSQCLAAWQ
jgi:hypothetical protein